MSLDVEPMTLEQLGKDIRKERLLPDGDACIGMCGTEGIGKSDAMMQLGNGIDKGFDVETNIAYSPNHEEVRHKVINVLQPFSAFGIDEAITVAYKRLFQARPQIFMNVTYTQCRDHNIASIFCMPDFFDFDKYWRDHRLCIWIQIIKKGYGVIFSKDWNPFTTDKWNMKFNEKYVIDAVGRKKVHEIDLERKISILLKSKNCIGWFKWDSMKDSMDDKLRNMWMRYKELKDAAKKTSYQDNLTGMDALTKIRIMKAVRRMYETDKMSQAKIGEYFNVGTHVVNDWLEKMGIRPIDKMVKKNA